MTIDWIAAQEIICAVAMVLFSAVVVWHAFRNR